MLREHELQTDKGEAAIIEGAGRDSNVVVVCEHAGTAIPAGLDNLGLDAQALLSHVAWDLGAARVADGLGRLLDAPVIKQRYSRLVYDCNRPPHSAEAMRAVSETTRIPGNENLSASDRAWRISHIYEPFHKAVDKLLDTRGQPVLVTVHSFTPVFHGQRREVEIGILHDADHRLADLLLADDVLNKTHDVRRNEPYGPRDGVTYSLQLHGISRGIANVMIEIRSDLISNDEACSDFAGLLASAVERAVGKISSRTGQTRSGIWKRDTKGART